MDNRTFADARQRVALPPGSSSANFCCLRDATVLETAAMSDARKSGLGFLGDSFRAQSRRRVADRVALALALLVACAGVGAVLEWINFPERRPVLLVTDLLFVTVAALWVT